MPRPSRSHTPDGQRPAKDAGFPLQPRCAIGVAAVLLACAATAQPAGSPPPTATAMAPEPKVERLVQQDGHSRIEELRVGGQTRSIDVHTRSALPGYEVRPIDPGVEDQRSGAGSRRWRVLAF
ncbi:MAG: hypothetical protein P3W97_006345 [Tepidimonas sp.]|uniref:hypothetical protein n=1 Tax=Tepidimonas sp. TaxID=2002775 RepID=UPI00259EB37D|nr:hypothetical protein [Tepidimonas sp.]MDM7456866.1 hypothetical protein [Tepidimonas sp.]